MAACTSSVPRTLLVISGGREAVPAILEARRMGLHVVVSDGAADAPGFRVADATLLASTYDADATVAAARAYATGSGIDGVLAVAADVPITVAAVADALRLPGPSLATATLAADKLAMKNRLATAGVPVPWYVAIESGDALPRLAAPGTLPLLAQPLPHPPA